MYCSPSQLAFSNGHCLEAQSKLLVRPNQRQLGDRHMGHRLRRFETPVL